MRHRSGIKKFLKIFFILIQAFVFIYSISLAIISVTLYYKAKDILQMHLTTLFLLLGISVASASSSLIGFQALNTKKKIKIFIYIFLSLVLINLQVILALKSSLLPEKSLKWGENMWEGMNEYQRSFIQERFKCCGFKDKGDRSVSECKYNSGCYDILYDMSLSLRLFIERSVVFLIFTESVGLSILALLKFRK